MVGTRANRSKVLMSRLVEGTAPGVLSYPPHPLYSTIKRKVVLILETKTRELKRADRRESAVLLCLPRWFFVSVQSKFPDFPVFRDASQTGTHVSLSVPGSHSNSHSNQPGETLLSKGSHPAPAVLQECLALKPNQRMYFFI